MAEAHIAAETRTEFGKGAARRTRRAGKIPAVLYGHGTDPQHLALPELEFKRIVREQGRNAVLTIDIAGSPQLALTKTVVAHPIRPYIEHVDLLVIRRGEKVTVDVAWSSPAMPRPAAWSRRSSTRSRWSATSRASPSRSRSRSRALAIGTQIHAGDLTLPANTDAARRCRAARRQRRRGHRGRRGRGARGGGDRRRGRGRDRHGGRAGSPRPTRRSDGDAGPRPGGRARQPRARSTPTPATTSASAWSNCSPPGPVAGGSRATSPTPTCWRAASPGGGWCWQAAHVHERVGRAGGRAGPLLRRASSSWCTTTSTSASASCA